MTASARPLRPLVLLFDLDGTLLDTGGAGRRAIEAALAAHGAAGGAGFSFAGMTDPAIVRRALGAAGRQTDEATLAAALASYLDRLAHEVATAPQERYRVCPGVRAALAAAHATPGCAVGLGTGNLRAGAQIKLARVALQDEFAFGGFGSDAERRDELLRIGAERGAELLGASVASCRVVVIGDTPMDIAAARQIGAECIAVATGPIPRAQLAAHRPDHLFADLCEPGALAALLGAN